MLAQTVNDAAEIGECRGVLATIGAFRVEANRIKLPSVFVLASQRADRQGISNNEIQLWLILRNENHVA